MEDMDRQKERFFEKVPLILCANYTKIVCMGSIFCVIFPIKRYKYYNHRHPVEKV